MTPETQKPMKPPGVETRLKKIKSKMLNTFSDIQDRTKGDEMAALVIWAVFFLMGLWYGALIINLIIEWTN